MEEGRVYGVYESGFTSCYCPCTSKPQGPGCPGFAPSSTTMPPTLRGQDKGEQCHRTPPLRWTSSYPAAASPHSPCRKGWHGARVACCHRCPGAAWPECQAQTVGPNKYFTDATSSATSLRVDAKQSANPVLCQICPRGCRRMACLPFSWRTRGVALHWGMSRMHRVDAHQSLRLEFL